MNDHPEAPVRAATAADVPAVRAVTDAAYRPYIARIGVVPQPMEADHMADVEEGCVFVMGEPITGLVVVRALGLPEIRLYTNTLMWENQQIYLRYGYELVERRVDGPYDRLHHRKPLDGTLAV
ncbi:GNAT family N-acetyltransferase [Streptomyces bauhiniae]|uniref:GNAT family N-acetyltransferase n=1 Tax=Streptomyces bauhiniae TaxID=2340725 RepID=UPI00382EB157